MTNKVVSMNKRCVHGTSEPQTQSTVQFRRKGFEPRKRHEIPRCTDTAV